MTIFNNRLEKALEETYCTFAIRLHILYIIWYKALRYSMITSDITDTKTFIEFSARNFEKLSCVSMWDNVPRMISDFKKDGMNPFFPRF